MRAAYVVRVCHHADDTKGASNRYRPAGSVPEQTNTSPNVTSSSSVWGSRRGWRAHPEVQLKWAVKLPPAGCGGKNSFHAALVPTAAVTVIGLAPAEEEEEDGDEGVRVTAISEPGSPRP